jgi:hypothetical protein
MRAKYFVVTALTLVAAIGVGAWILADQNGSDMDVTVDTPAASIGIPAPETGGLTPLAPETQVETDGDGKLPDEVLYIEGEPRQDPNAIEDLPIEGAGMLVPGFEGEVTDMIVEIQ